MKKSIVALAVLGSFAGVAAAQSSVTLFGVVDAAVRYTSANGQSVTGLASGGSSTSRFGVRGVEDLGGGLKAGFWLESAINVDAGTTDTAFWARRSTISLMGDFGEVRLGRFKTSARLQIEEFDPTVTTGLGSVAQVYSALGSGADLSRYDNEATYILPGNLGGFYGSVDAAAGEGTAAKKMFSGRVGYKLDAFNVSAAYAESGVNNKFKLMTVGGSYDFGMAKAMLTYSTTKFSPAEQEIYTLAVTAPVGAGSVFASFTDSKYTNKTTVIAGLGDAKLYAAGYIYNLSKRTALYTTVALIDNGKNATFALNGGSPKVGADGRSGGFDVGVKHSF